MVNIDPDKEIHETFDYSYGLTKVFFIDNSVASNSEISLLGKANGNKKGESACKKAKDIRDKYLNIPEVKAFNLNDSNLPTIIPVFADIEPDTKIDKEFVEGWLESFANYNSDKKVQFRPGLYINLDTERATHGSRNLKIISDINDPNLLIWQQQPQKPLITEIDIFDHGYRPSQPTIKGLWQFNISDSRFRISSKNFWIDHNLATEECFNLFWEGDQKSYFGK